MIIHWETVLRIILDGMPVEHFLAYFTLMGAGSVAYFGINVWQSRVASKNTPDKFSWGFMIRDNAWRILSTSILIAGAVIFYDSFFGVPLNAKLALMQGFSIDALTGTVLKVAKERGPLKKSRDRLMMKYQ